VWNIGAIDFERYRIAEFPGDGRREFLVDLINFFEV